MTFMEAALFGPCLKMTSTPVLALSDENAVSGERFVMTFVGSDRVERLVMMLTPLMFVVLFCAKLSEGKSLHAKRARAKRKLDNDFFMCVVFSRYWWKQFGKEAVGG